MEQILKFFQDNCGNNRTMRLFVFMILITVLFNWTFVNIKTGQINPLSWQEIAMVVGGLLAKAKQKERE